MSVPRPIGPRDLPALRDHLLDQWRPGRPFSQVADVMRRGQAPGWPFTHLDPRFDSKQLRAAALWWVDDDATELVDATRGDYPGDVVLGEGVMPVHPSGLAVFARPLVGTDAMTQGNPVNVDAVLWGPVNLPRLPSEGPGPRERLGLSMSAYSWWDYDRGLSAEQMSDPRASQIMAMEAETLRQVYDRTTPIRDPKLPRGSRSVVMHDGFWVPLGRSDWVLGTALDAQLAELKADPGRWDSMREDRQLMGALWSLAAQPHITHQATETLTGPERRRHVRQHGKDTPAEVHVLRLRPQRTERGDGEGRAVRWSVRWPVRQHWRNQACGPGRKMRRPVLVPGHIKGPAGAPLKRPSATVWRLDGDDPTTEGE